MPHYAPVVPINVADYLDRHGVLGNYHLLLAHDVVKYPNQYKALYDTPYKTIIMDNSVCELGTAVDLDMVVEACKIVTPTSIVLPDVYTDAASTIASCTEAYPLWVERFGHVAELKRWGSSWGFMYVPQGRTISEFVTCAEAMANHEFYPSINCWGVPRNLVQFLGSRVQATTLVGIMNRQRHIHLLGLSDDIIDDVQTLQHHKHNQRLMGIDSAVPVRLADTPLNQEISLGLQKIVSRKQQVNGEDWWEHATPNATMLHNIRTFRRWIR